MMQIRWKQRSGTTTDRPVLQFRTINNFEEIGIQEPIWNEWEDVPTEFIDDYTNTLIKESGILTTP